MIGKAPGWILKSGITIVFLVIFLLGFLAALIKFPDKIKGAVLMRSENPSIDIKANYSLKIDSVLVTNDQYLEAGEIVLIFESTGSWEDIKQLKNWIRQLRNLLVDGRRIQYPILDQLQVGEMQESYAQLVFSIKNRQHYLEQNQVGNKILSFDLEHRYLSEMNKNLQKQQLLLDNELELILEDLERTKKLFQNGVKSQLELEDHKKIVLQFERQIQSLASNQLQHKIRIEQLKRSKTNLQEEFLKVTKDFDLTIGKLIEITESRLENWDTKYLVRTPINGKITILDKIVTGRQVPIGETIGTIVPIAGLGRTVAVTKVPVKGIGKLDTGSTLLIALEAYPSEEFGLLKTTVAGISRVPVEASSDEWQYHLISYVGSPLETTYGRQIPFRQNLTGIGTILTDEKSLLARIYSGVYNLLESH